MSPDVLTGLLMAALLLAAAALATRPWWRRNDSRVPDRKAANVAAYRLRVSELETEAAAGLIPTDEAASLRAELDARLLNDAGDSAAEPKAAEGRRPMAVAVVGIMLALFAAGGYVGSGSWKVQREIATAVEAPKPALDPQVAAMVGKLAEKLKQQPDDPQAWAMLGRSYFVMQRYDDAAKAYDEANTRAKAPNAGWLTDESEALAFAGNREVSGRSAELVEQALALEPDFGKALWYGGLAAAQAGNFTVARNRWQKLLQATDLPQPMRDALEERLKTIDEAVASQGPASAAPSGETDAASAPAPAGPGLKINVSLAPELASKVPAGATLFVFAKAETGPQIPLAVQRLSGAKLPLELTLDDSMAMAPQLRMSQFERYVITARLSASGGAQAQSGDLEGRISAARAQAGGAALPLTIDHLVP
jgi:cytochrome c-type biogenesis protein CcmH